MVCTALSQLLGDQVNSLGSGAGSVSKHDTLWDIVSAAGVVKDCSDSSEAGHGGVEGNMAC